MSHIARIPIRNWHQLWGYRMEETWACTTQFQGPVMFLRGASCMIISHSSLPCCSHVCPVNAIDSTVTSLHSASLEKPSSLLHIAGAPSEIIVCIILLLVLWVLVVYVIHMYTHSEAENVIYHASGSARFQTQCDSRRKKKHSS